LLARFNRKIAMLRLLKYLPVVLSIIGVIRKSRKGNTTMPVKGRTRRR